jgi:endonuclease/exonuclease/phosphatase family metal-dependent hydrolase
MKRIIIAGDFNSSALWDASHVGNSHSDVVMELKKMGIRSLYHEYRKEKQGEELLMTHWNRRRSYHIDYIFADKQFFKSVTGIHIGKRSVWKDRSDHVPLIADLKIDKSVGKGK